MSDSYNIDSIAYLRRARRCLDQNNREALFYAAFELRCGTESRLQQYLDARKDIAHHKKQGWRIIGSSRELDRRIQLGDTIYEACLSDDAGNSIFLYYTPISARLRESAGARLHDLLHAMKSHYENDNRWWGDTRDFLEQIYCDLALASRGTLLAPILRSPDGKSYYMAACILDESPISDKIQQFSQIGNNFTIKVRYHKSVPSHAIPFLNVVDG
jgi:hypothetical protein